MDHSQRRKQDSWVKVCAPTRATKRHAWSRDDRQFQFTPSARKEARGCAPGLRPALRETRDLHGSQSTGHAWSHCPGPELRPRPGFGPAGRPNPTDPSSLPAVPTSYALQLPALLLPLAAPAARPCLDLRHLCRQQAHKPVKLERTGPCNRESPNHVGITGPHQQHRFCPRLGGARTRPLVCSVVRPQKEGRRWGPLAAGN